MRREWGELPPSYRHVGDSLRARGLGHLSNRLRSSADRCLKRALDLAASSIVLLVLAPVLVLVAAMIVAESRGGVFYRCRRVGRGGIELRMIKFRKMKARASGLPVTGAHDSRFTRIGRVLAKSKLDEVPQLWNVVTGEMSLVGPRPEDPIFVEFRERDYEEILRVKPGITGLAQLAFARESEILDDGDRVGDYVGRILPQKLAIDRLYVRRRSFGMDLRIIAWTVFAVVLRRDVAVDRLTGRLSFRRRPVPHAAPALVDPGHEAPVLVESTQEA